MSDNFEIIVPLLGVQWTLVIMNDWFSSSVVISSFVLDSIITTSLTAWFRLLTYIETRTLYVVFGYEYTEYIIKSRSINIPKLCDHWIDSGIRMISISVVWRILLSVSLVCRIYIYIFVVFSIGLIFSLISIATCHCAIWLIIIESFIITNC